MTLRPWDHQARTYSAAKRLEEWQRSVADHNSFARLGYHVFPRLPRDTALALREKVSACPITREGCIEHYDMDALLQLTELRTIALSESIMALACIWLGTNPRILDVSAWRTTPGETPELPQRWHRDMDDWRTVKFFLYLTDTDADSGPHQYVSGSHREEFFTAHGLPPEMYFYGSGRTPDIAASIDQLPRVDFHGPAGFCFATNNYAFHRGLPVKSGERVVFQTAYVINDWPHMAARTRQIRTAWGI